MPLTSRFGWEQPDVAGDVGTWGGIMNVTLSEIDTDLGSVLDTVTTHTTSIGAAQAQADAAYALALNVQGALAAKVLVSSVPPTAANVHPDGTLWCVV